MNVRRPMPAPFAQEAMLAGLEDASLSEIINNINKLIYLSKDGQVWEIAALDYHTVSLYPRAVYLRDHLAEGSARLHFSGREIELPLCPTNGDLWRFEISHHSPHTLSSLREILEPLHRGARLTPRRLEVDSSCQPNCIVLTADSNTHVTYCRSGSSLDYLRVGFESGGTYHEMIWTRQGFLTKSLPIEQGQRIETILNPWILIYAAFIVMGLRDRKAKVELSKTLNAVLAFGVATLRAGLSTARAS